jgi:hypothetical protein
MVMDVPLSRRTVLTAGAALTGAAVAGLGTPRARAADLSPGLTATITDHGVAAAERNVRTGAAGVRADGTPLLYLLSDGNPVSFNVLDADTGTLVGAFPLPPKSIGSYPTVAPDGTAYFSVRDGQSSRVHRYDPVRNTVEFLVQNPSGDHVVRTLRVDEDTLYGSTYPRAEAFAYDLKTGNVRDYGRVWPSTDTYAWGFEKVGGTLYVGTGIGEGHVVTVDVASGEKTRIPLPAGYDERLTYFYWFRRIGHLVAMAFSPGMPDGTNTLFWDTRAGDWVHDGAIGTFLNLNGPITTDTPDGKAYYKSAGEIHEFDSATGTTRATGWAATGLASTGSHRTLDLVMAGRGAAAHPVLLGGNNDGSFWRFDPTSGDHRFFESAVEGAPLTAHAVNAGPDERVYVSTYLGPGAIARFDPATGAKDVLDGPGQVDSFLTIGDEMLLGSYANAVVHRGRPAEPWNFGTNPAKQFELIGWDQDRIIDMATDGERIALGTVSDYGITGGALTLLAADGTRTVHRDLVDRQSVASVTFGPDGLVYAGTSIRGGLSSPNSSGDAELVVVDPATGSVVHHEVAVPGNDVVAGLAVGVDGQIWGVTNTGHLFAFDPAQRRISRDLDLGTGLTSSPWGLSSTLHAHPTDGLLYGLAGKRIFAADPLTGGWQFLADQQFKRLAIAPGGDLHAIDETHLYTVTIRRR